MLSREISSTGAFLSGVAMRLVLVLSLWHAPLPWVHSHAVAEPAEGALHLSRHVHALHADDVMHGASHVGWHWHFVLPWCVEGETRCPTESPSDDDGHMGFAMKFGVASSAAQQLEHDASAWVSNAFDTLATCGEMAAATPVSSRADEHRHRGRHFLETYGQSVSAAELVGVRLC